MYQELTQITAALDELDAIDAHKQAAFDLAQGVYMDDPVEPSVGFLVWRGKVADVFIADPVSKMDRGDAARLINGVAIKAYQAWHADYIHKLSGFTARG